MGQLSLEGSLSGGPQTVSDGGFPASVFQVSLGFADGLTKQFGVASGVLTRQMNSSGAFVALSGVGASDAVTNGTALYFKCNADMSLEITTDDGVGGSVVAVLPMRGVLVLEVTDLKFIKLLRCKGVGPIEYLVAGPA